MREFPDNDYCPRTPNQLALCTQCLSCWKPPSVTRWGAELLPADRCYASMPRAKWMAASTAAIFSGANRAIRRWRRFVGTALMTSRLTTESRVRPSSGPRITSPGRWRTRVVTGATVTYCRSRYAESRERRDHRPASAGRVQIRPPQFATPHLTSPSSHGTSACTSRLARYIASTSATSSAVSGCRR